MTDALGRGQERDMTTAASTDTTTPTGKQRRGFASMAPEQRSAIASKGGKAAHAMGKAHTWTSETASAAGKKGGVAKHVNRQIAQTSGQDANQTTTTQQSATEAV